MNSKVISPFTEYAGFWRRMVATTVDSIWLLGLFLIALYFIDPQGFTEFVTYDNIELEPSWKDHLYNALIGVIVISLWYRYAATPGKWLVDCKIVDARTGNSLTLLQTIIRYFAYIISALPLGLGFLWILWDKRKQGWHDKIAKTVVIVHDEATLPLEKLVKLPFNSHES